MVGGRFLRLCVSGAIILRLTLFSAVLRVEATSFIGDDVVDCTDQFLACNDDEVCWSCLTEHDDTQYDECVDAALDTVADSELSSTCSFEIAPCCVDDASEHACMDNDIYVEHWECIIEGVQTGSSECPTVDLSCSHVSSSVGGSNSGVDASSRKLSTGAFVCILGLAAALGLPGA